MSNISLQILTSDESIAKLCRQYWETNESGQFIYTVSDIAASSGLNSAKIKKIVDQNCIARSSSKKCSKCGSPYTYSGRTEYQNYKRYPDSHPWACQKCIRQSEISQKEEMMSQEKKIRLSLREMYEKSRKRVIDPFTLSLKDIIYYLSVIRLGASEDFSVIIPVQLFSSKLTPSGEFDEEILVHLYHRGLIAIHPESQISAFFIHDNDIRYYPSAVNWIPLVAFEQDSIQGAVEFLEYLFQANLWQDQWKDEVQSLGRRIALEECIEYLSYSLKEHHISFKAGDKTRLVINLALENLSVAQIYNFIWRVARNAGASCQRGEKTRQHAANYAVWELQKFVEQARDQGWEVKPYGRSFVLRRTMISQVFFSTALHIGDGGFTMQPNAWITPENTPSDSEKVSLEGAKGEKFGNTQRDIGNKNRPNNSNDNRSRRSKNRKKRKR